MPSVVAGLPSMTTRREGLQPHIPKLTYRNCPSNTSISEGSIVTIKSQSSAASISTCPTSPPTSSFGGSPRSFHCSDGPLSPLSLDGASDSPRTSALPSSRSAKDTKKKSFSVFGFLSVKEPSTQALEAYQEQMKRRGTTQSGRANAVGLPGVSSAKLPPTVPKVNSKWDGVPQTAKDKTSRDVNLDRQSLYLAASRPLHTSRSTGSSMTAMTSSSTSSKSSTGSAPRGNGNLRYDHDSKNLSDLYGWETGSLYNRSSNLSLPLESRGSASSAPTLCHENSMSFFSRPQAIAGSTDELPANTPPPLDHSSNLSSPMISPATPPLVTPNGSLHTLPLSPRVGHSSGDSPTRKSLNTKNGGVILASSGTYSQEPVRPYVTRANNKTGPPSNDLSERPSTQPGSILKRPPLIADEIWPVPPSPANDEDENTNVRAAATTNSTKSRFRSMFSKGT
ncbi:MAG: hypothetical protein Q9210_004890 [Variospora velana]